MFLSSISVLNSLRHSRGRGDGDSAMRQISSMPADCSPEKQEQRRQVAAHNAGSARFAGMLIENHHDVFGRPTHNQLWVVLDPAEATLSIWDQHLSKAQLRQRTAEAPKRVFSMSKITEVDSNPSFRNIFLWFEGGEALSFATEKAEDFEDWMSAFAPYDGNQVVAQSGQSLAAQNEAAHSQLAVLPAKVSDIINPAPVLLPCRSSQGGSGPKRDASPETRSDSCVNYGQGYLSEPSPVPAPGFQVADKNEDDSSPRSRRRPPRQLNKTDYNTPPPMEMRAVRTSMGIGGPAQELPRICEDAASCELIGRHSPIVEYPT